MIEHQAEPRRLPVTEDVSLHVLASGVDHPGAPVLLVHGLASNARLWDGVARPLAAAGHPVAAVDQRGHGQSDKPDDGYDFATLTDDLLAVVTALGWYEGGRPPWLAGQSWGANVVLEVAARHPGSVSGLVLVDGGTMELSTRFADWATCAAALAPPPLTGTSATSFERLLRTHHPDWPETGIAGTLANVEVRADGTIQPWLSRPHHMTILRHMWAHDLPARYPLVKVPVLLLPAEDQANQRWMAGKRQEVARAGAALERSVTRWIAGDHDLHAEHPALIAGLIHDATGPGFFS
jgi:pimeloyl-ACP methyl ester carboxylesterase